MDRSDTHDRCVDTGPLVVRLPGLVTLPAFHVAGPARRFDAASRAEIPQLWPALIAVLPFAGQVPGRVTYGIVSQAAPSDGSFHYMAGVGVEPDCVPPKGFATMAFLPRATWSSASRSTARRCIRRPAGRWRRSGAN